MNATIEQLTAELHVNEGVLVRICKYLGIEIYDQTIGYQMGKDAVVQHNLVRFLLQNKSFIQNYQTDYYIRKSPHSIAAAIDRPVMEVTNFLKTEYPRCFINGKFGLNASKLLKYVSSYEIDYEMEIAESPELSYMNHATWHLGIKQKKIIDEIQHAHVSKFDKSKRMDMNASRAISLLQQMKADFRLS
tara:strand:+ start:4298 stop:4864 length:567 start_codon:yes stop_codon:yes gene_type:complete